MILALAVSIGVGLIIASAVTATCLGKFLTALKLRDRLIRFVLTAAVKPPDPIQGILGDNKISKKIPQLKLGHQNEGTDKSRTL